MTRRLIICPSTDRLLMRKFASRLDQNLGYPRTLAESEIERTGPASQRAPRPRIDTAWTVWIHDNTGAPLLHGAIALEVNGIADRLRDRFVEHLTIRKRARQWIADQGWVIRADLPGDVAAWSLLPPRDGASGSADGRPIPEGEE